MGEQVKQCTRMLASADAPCTHLDEKLGAHAGGGIVRGRQGLAGRRGARAGWGSWPVIGGTGGGETARLGAGAHGGRPAATPAGQRPVTANEVGCRSSACVTDGARWAGLSKKMFSF